jgi:hypothetical protein
MGSVNVTSFGIAAARTGGGGGGGVFGIFGGGGGGDRVLGQLDLVPKRVGLVLSSASAVTICVCVYRMHMCVSIDLVLCLCVYRMHIFVYM